MMEKLLFAAGGLLAGYGIAYAIAASRNQASAVSLLPPPPVVVKPRLTHVVTPVTSSLLPARPVQAKVV